MEDKIYKILAVDDERDFVDTLKIRLSREGYDVVVAYDGNEALSQVAKEDPDLILLDLMLPDKNGFEVLEEVRKNHNEKWKPVIIVSAKSDLETLKKGYRLEADHYITKPCNIGDILHGIKTMISLIPHRINLD
ncbi:MAG: response regulator [Candidatus Omnitrophota bacterium]